MKPFKNQRGMIDIVLIVVLAVAIAAFGGYVYYQQQQANKTYDAAGSGATVSKHAKKTTKKTTTSTPATADWFVISQFGVEGKATSGVTLQYAIKTADGVQVAYFTSAELMALEAGCTTSFGPGGAISQYPPGTDYHGSPIDSNASAKKVGNFYYIFDQPQAYCSVAEANQGKEATVQSAVKNVLGTLQAKP